jgi:hypothetical protein
VEEQQARAAAAGLTPAEYAAATQEAALEHLAKVGEHHANGKGDGMQRAGFLKQLWGVAAVSAVPEQFVAADGRVLATIYEIGGPLTGVLSASVAKQLPLIPHVGIRVNGVEYFYSDHIEFRSVPVMKEMLADCPQVTLDLGPAALDDEGIKRILAELELEWEAKDYHVFDKNCVHFGQVLAQRVCADSPDGVPQPLIQGVLDVSERMLDSLPEWRAKLGRRVMNEVTRLVVVSWGRQTAKKKEEVADSLGVDRGN